MKSFFKGVWSRTKRKPALRDLNHPQDLMLGDMIQLSDSYALPPRLRDQAFRVIGIATYQFEHEFSTCFSLQGQNQDEIDLVINNTAGRGRATFSLGISPKEVAQIFNLDQFALIFDSEETLELVPRHDAAQTHSIKPWLAGRYHLNSRSERGFYYDKDCRGDGPSDYQGAGEAFEFYGLVSDDGKTGIEIEVYQGGETEVSLILKRPVTDIVELWPADQP